jgi:hypothetical protein
MKQVGGGTITFAQNQVAQPLSTEPLVANLIFIGAPCNATTGVATNTQPAFVGSAGKELAVVQPNDFKWGYLPAEDAAAVLAKGKAGEKLVWLAFAGLRT